jgi:hypothetical protein
MNGRLNEREIRIVTRLITKEIYGVEAKLFTGTQSSSVSQPPYWCVPARPLSVAGLTMTHIRLIDEQ